LKPRIQLSLAQEQGFLSVFPLLVYGAPPSVRIDAGRMVYLRGPVPLRDEAAEQRLSLKLRDELNLVPGRKSRFEGQDMDRLASRLRHWQGDLTGDAAGFVSGRARLVPRLEIQSVTAGPGGAPQVR